MRFSAKCRHFDFRAVAVGVGIFGFHLRGREPILDKKKSLISEGLGKDTAESTADHRRRRGFDTWHLDWRRPAGSSGNLDACLPQQQNYFVVGGGIFGFHLKG